MTENNTSNIQNIFIKPKAISLIGAAVIEKRMNGR
jgi:hypothetical protein